MYAFIGIFNPEPARVATRREPESAVHRIEPYNRHGLIRSVILENPGYMRPRIGKDRIEISILIEIKPAKSPLGYGVKRTVEAVDRKSVV